MYHKEKRKNISYIMCSVVAKRRNITYNYTVNNTKIIIKGVTFFIHLLQCHGYGFHWSMHWYNLNEENRLNANNQYHWLLEK